VKSSIIINRNKAKWPLSNLKRLRRAGRIFRAHEAFPIHITLAVAALALSLWLSCDLLINLINPAKPSADAWYSTAAILRSVFWLALAFLLYKKKFSNMVIFSEDKLFTEKNVYFAFLGPMAISLFTTFWLDYIVKPQTQQGAAQLLQGVQDNFVVKILFIIELVFLAPIVEELFFRRLIFTSIFSPLKKIKSGYIIAILAQAAVFAAFHNNLDRAVPLFVSGVVLGATFYYTRNLWVCVFSHFMVNAVYITGYIIS